MIEYNIRKEKNKKYLFIIPLIFFIIDYLLIQFHFIESIDQFVYNLIQCIRCDIVTELMKLFSFLGSTYFYIAAILLLIIFKNKENLYIGIHLLVVQGINRVIKFIIKRPRPPKQLHLVNETNYSFPSGHSMSAMVGYGFFIIEVKNSHLKYKNIFVILLSLMIFLIGMSRIYLGVHYFSDVLGGYLIGLSYVLFVYYNTSLYA